MKIKYFWKPFLWLIVICYALFVPASDLPSKPFLAIPHFDKLVHFSLFFVLCLLLFKPFKKIKLKNFYYASLTSLLTGALLESIQHFVTESRSSDLFDFASNIAGIVAATFFYRFFVSNKKWEKFI